MYEQLESFAFSIPIGPYKTIKPASNMVSKVTISVDEEQNLHMENLEKNFGLVEFYQEKEDWKKWLRFPKRNVLQCSLYVTKGDKGKGEASKTANAGAKNHEERSTSTGCYTREWSQITTKGAILALTAQAFVTSAWQISELLWISDFYVSLITLLEWECLLRLSLSAPLCV